MYFRRGRLTPVSSDELMEANGFDPPDPTTTNQEKARVENELRQYHDFLAVQSKMKDLPMKYQEVISLRYVPGGSASVESEARHRGEENHRESRQS